jgi:hypothetical protein
VETTIHTFSFQEGEVTKAAEETSANKNLSGSFKHRILLEILDLFGALRN